MRLKGGKGAGGNVMKCFILVASLVGNARWEGGGQWVSIGH